VTLTAGDNLSGTAATYYSIDGGAVTAYGAPFSVGKGVHTVTYWSRDLAGNVEDKTASGHTLTIKVDNLAPTISGAPTTSSNANDWYNGPVTVHFACSDAETAIQSCPADQTLSAEGAGQYVSGTATDAAGNTATAKVEPINIDRTAPAFAPYTGATTFTVGQTVPVPACQASDALSGLDSCTLVKSGSGLTNPNGVGDFTYTFTATDKAGNTSTQSVTLHVGYKFSGFLQPVTNTAHDLGSASSFKAGSTIPFKFTLSNAGGKSIAAAYMPVWLAPVDGGTTSTDSTVQDGAAAATVGGSFKADGSGQYSFNWQTPKSGAGHYYRVGVQLDSGDVYTTLIVLK
jgi:hypothetical protein